MAHVVTDVDTKIDPGGVIAALTDFSPKRLELWPNIDRRYYRVDSTGTTSADVTEGSSGFGGVWERAHYDWSQPGTIRLEVKDSNAFEPGSYWIYEVTRNETGGSHVHMEFDRRPRNFKGQVVGTLLSLFGRGIFTKSLNETFARMEKANLH